MADLPRAYSKSAQVVEYLITGKGRIKERLLEACQDGFVDIDREALPNDLKSVYDQIQELVVARSLPLSGAYVRAVENLSEDEAECAAWSCMSWSASFAPPPNRSLNRVVCVLRLREMSDSESVQD